MKKCQKLIERIKAIKAILFAEEYFVSVANTKGPIVYEYFSNTDSNMFYLFINHHIKKYINYVGD